MRPDGFALTHYLNLPAGQITGYRFSRLVAESVMISVTRCFHGYFSIEIVSFSTLENYFSSQHWRQLQWNVKIQNKQCNLSINMRIIIKKTNRQKLNAESRITILGAKIILRDTTSRYISSTASRFWYWHWYKPLIFCLNINIARFWQRYNRTSHVLYWGRKDGGHWYVLQLRGCRRVSYPHFHPFVVPTQSSLPFS